LKDNPQKILNLPLRLAIVILLFGALFKLMHWPFAKELMFLGGILIGVLYTIRFFNKKDKYQLDYVKLTFVLLWVFSYLVQVFHLFYVPYIFEVCLLILFLWWFIKEGSSYFKNRKFNKKGPIRVMYYILIGLASFLLFFGLIFKIQHWPYGSELFVLGIVLLNTIVILDYFIIERAS
tara:strand:+ start:288 stop:821 length:534 start_codon:yes stop_codon:yes gene_type:complete